MLLGQVKGFQGAKTNPDGTANTSISGPDGVVIVDHKEVWAGDGDSTVKVIDIKSMSITHSISTGDALKDKRVDEMAYDPQDHILAVANNAAKPPFVTLIDTREKKILKKIVFDGTNNTPNATDTGLEQPQWSPKTGLFYISVPQIVPGTDDASKAKGGVSVIDTDGTVIQTFEVDFCSPTGLTLGPKNQALVGCGGAFGISPNVTVRTPIINIITGREIKSYPIGGEDEVWFDAATQHYYVPARNNVNASGDPVPLLVSIDAQTMEMDPTIATSITAHSVAVDPKSHNVFIPIGLVPTSAKSGTDPDNICAKSGCIAVYRPSFLDSDDKMASK